MRSGQVQNSAYSTNGRTSTKAKEPRYIHVHWRLRASCQRCCWPTRNEYRMLRMHAMSNSACCEDVAPSPGPSAHPQRKQNRGREEVQELSKPKPESMPLELVNTVSLVQQPKTFIHLFSIAKYCTVLYCTACTAL